jgi:hypothetical protein
MTMKDDYLWDRTGEPDAEIQQLEELLGSLRYQPRPLEIPSSMNVRRKPGWIPLAIAAAIAVIMIGAGLWMRFANSHPAGTEQAIRTQPSAAPSHSPPDSQESMATTSGPKAVNLPQRRMANRTLVAYKPRRPVETAAPVLTEEELAQKEQVLVALRLVSVKLNLAQRKAQGLPPVNAIRNHKIG